MKNKIRIINKIGILLIACLLLGISANAQRIILDKRVRAGELTLFPDMEDENAYYYLPDKLKLATDANGKPEFSFLRFVENVRSAGGEDEIREGIGGGIVHAVIELYVSPEQIQEARRELRKLNPEGKLQGPAMYTSGTFTIISSFVNTEGDLSKQVVGLGKAPLIDGHKAAVSMELTKKGAKILWESFKTPTPDMSFSFEMELEGFSSPKQAVIEADFEKIYNHHGFQLGASGNYNNIVFGGEIDIAFDELRNSGAIKIDNKGADEDMEKLIETAYNKLTTMMFDPIGGTGNPLMKDLVSSIKGKKSPMDRATDLYKQNKGTADKKEPAKNSTPATKKDTAKKTSMLWNYPALNDNLLLAYKGKHYQPEYFYAPLLSDAQQNEWQPSHIKDEYKKWINEMPVKPETRQKYKASVDRNEYLETSAMINEAVAGNSDKPYLYYNKFIFTPEELTKYSDYFKTTKNLPEELKKLISSRITQIVEAQDYLNKVQKAYILKTLPQKADDYFIGEVSLAYIAYVNKEKLVHVPSSAKGKEMVERIFELRTKKEDEDIKPIGDGLLDYPDDDDDAKVDTKGKTDSKEDKSATTDKKAADGSKEKPVEKAVSEAAKKASDKAASATAATKAAADKKTEADKKKASETAKKAEAEKEKKKADAKKKEKADFKLAVMASYQFKKMKQTGKFKINLNKYTADKLVLRFDENIGQIDCNECFYQVNLDDPLFKQREIVAMVDGFNADDFGKYINYVSLKVKKTHQSGDVTYDEVRIDRDNFVKSANNFKVLYGWKGDDDRNQWLDYQYQAQWSFFGGNEVVGAWQQANANVINLAPPYLRKTIELEADPEFLKDKEVRSINVKLFYKIGDKEEVKQVSMMPSREQYSEKVDIMLPGDATTYDYEITWRLTGNRTATTGRLTASEQILFVDEVIPN